VDVWQAEKQAPEKADWLIAGIHTGWIVYLAMVCDLDQFFKIQSHFNNYPISSKGHIYKIMWSIVVHLKATTYTLEILHFNIGSCDAVHTFCSVCWDILVPWMSSTLSVTFSLHSTCARFNPPSSPNGLSASNNSSRPELYLSPSDMCTTALSPVGCQWQQCNVTSVQWEAQKQQARDKGKFLSNSFYCHSIYRNVYMCVLMIYRAPQLWTTSYATIYYHGDQLMLRHICTGVSQGQLKPLEGYNYRWLNGTNFYYKNVIAMESLKI